VIELQHDHEYLPTLLDVMAAASGSGSPRAVAEQTLEHLLGGAIAAGGVWIYTGANLGCLARSDLEHADVDSTVARVIATGAPAFLGPAPGWPEHHLAILPLQVAGAPTGALVAAAHGEIAPRLRLALQVIATHLGIALDHARMRQHNPAAAEREWEEFLAHAAHEIKNPLASIKGYADLLLRRAAKDPADPYQKGLATISQQVGRTTTLLEQLADISRIGIDRLPIDRHEADLAVIVDRTVQEYQASSSQHQLASDHAGEQLRGRFDEFRISQVIGAMLSNAIKFAPDGGRINVKLRRTAKDDAAEGLVAVHGFGVGVPAGEHERIFERFFRGSNVRGSFSGLGVGLYIGRAIVGLHGGRMWLESAPELGTTCYMALPLI
jgi:signal transduction histidine kinase